MTSTEYRADNVAILQDRKGRPVTGVIVEVQRKQDRDKRRSWPVYVTTLHAQLDCPAVLLVLAPRPAVAAWARRTIDLGHPGFRLTPLVIGFDDVPRIRDRTAASQLPELAMLSVMAHPELEIAQVAIGAIAQLPDDRARLYLDVILNALPAKLRQSLEAQMIKGYQYQSSFARKYYGQGREEGLRAAVVALAQTKLKTMSDDHLAKIASIADLRVLTELVTSLGQARTAAAARAALTRALGRQSTGSRSSAPSAR